MCSLFLWSDLNVWFLVVSYYLFEITEIICDHCIFWKEKCEWYNIFVPDWTCNKKKVHVSHCNFMVSTLENFSAMFTGNLQTSEGLEDLNIYLSDRSYLSGFRPSQVDAYVFETLGNCPSDIFPHVCRWYRHIASFGMERKNFPSQTNAVENISRNMKENLVPLMENNRIDSLQVRSKRRVTFSVI